MDPVSLQRMADVLDGQLIDVPDPARLATGVSIDTRALDPGSVFWALSGGLTDGHRFLAEAWNRGSPLAVVAADQADLPAGPKLAVRSPRESLSTLAAWYRRQLDSLVIGVTGSVGKTTTRDLIYTVLSGEFPGCRAERNFNNELGLPLSVLRMESEHEFAVLELAARRAGDIRNLAEICQPEVGVVTAVGPAHLETFGSLDGVEWGKGELMEALPSSGFAVLASDDPRVRRMARRARCRVIHVGQSEHCDVRASSLDMTSDGLAFRVDGQQYHLRAFAPHLLSNCLCAIAIAIEVGVTPAQIAEALGEFRLLDGRGRVLSIGGVTVIDDTYNASLSSVEAGLGHLASLPLIAGRRRIAVLGDMLELGKNAADIHVLAGRSCVERGADLVLAFGEHAGAIISGAAERGAAVHGLAEAHDFEALLAILDCWIEPGDAVLVKGSRGMRMERVIDWLRQRSGHSTELAATALPKCA